MTSSLQALGPPLLLDLSLHGSTATEYVLKHFSQGFVSGGVFVSTGLTMPAIMLSTPSAKELCEREAAGKGVGGRRKLRLWAPEGETGTGGTSASDDHQGGASRESQVEETVKKLIGDGLSREYPSGEYPAPSVADTRKVTPAGTESASTAAEMNSAAATVMRQFTPGSSESLSKDVGHAAATLVLGDLSSLARYLPATAAGHDEQPQSTLLDVELHVAYRRQLLWSCSTALSCLAPGGCLVLRLGHTLTSFSGTLLYLLYRRYGQPRDVSKIWKIYKLPFCNSACTHIFLIIHP